MVHILPSLALKSRPLSRPQGTPFLLSDLLRSRASVFRQELLEKMKAQENKQKEQRQQHGSWATAESIAEDLILTYPQWFGVVFLK